MVTNLSIKMIILPHNRGGKRKLNLFSTVLRLFTLRYNLKTKAKNLEFSLVVVWV